jgi:phenylalanyl-tRNA synthetase alpha chain
MIRYILIQVMNQLIRNYCSVHTPPVCKIPSSKNIQHEKNKNPVNLLYLEKCIDTKTSMRHMIASFGGVVIDKNISIAHFKSMIEQILKAMLETDEVEFRMRPAFFPFTEPGFEIDAKQVINGKTKRIESLGAGMIHPNVLEQAGVDPKEYSGFAFGMGMSRLVAIKNKIHDIRLFTNGDLRFAKSFTTVL